MNTVEISKENKQRAERAYRALLHYGHAKDGSEDVEINVQDLFTDIMHLSREGYGFELRDVFEVAERNFEAEVEEEKQNN